MLAWIDYSIPKLFNAKSVILLLVLIFLAYLISPRSSLDKKERDRLVLVYPLLVFVYVLLFQVFFLSLNSHVHYYLGPTGVFTWRMNTGICCAFGIAFSFRILRTPGLGWRFYGGVFPAAVFIVGFWQHDAASNEHIIYAPDSDQKGRVAEFSASFVQSLHCNGLYYLEVEQSLHFG